MTAKVLISSKLLYSKLRHYGEYFYVNSVEYGNGTLVINIGEMDHVIIPCHCDKDEFFFSMRRHSLETLMFVIKTIGEMPVVIEFSDNALRIIIDA